MWEYYAPFLYRSGAFSCFSGNQTYSRRILHLAWIITWFHCPCYTTELSNFFPNGNWNYRCCYGDIHISFICFSQKQRRNYVIMLIKLCYVNTKTQIWFTDLNQSNRIQNQCLWWPYFPRYNHLCCTQSFCLHWVHFPLLHDNIVNKLDKAGEREMRKRLIVVLDITD